MKIISLLSFALAVATATLCSAAETVSFQVKVTGHGRPMILIPGLASPGAVWDATVTHFNKDYECHVLTLAGFGGTPARSSADTPLIAAARDELAAYIREHKLDHPVIVGHSLGGFLALEIAIKYPELAGQLVIVDSLPFLVGIMKPGATIDDAKQAADATASAFSKMDPENYSRMIRGGPNGSIMAAATGDLDRIVAWGLASDPTTVAKAMGEMYTTDLRSELTRIKSPTLVLAAWVGYAPYSSHQFVEQVYRDQYAKLAGFQLTITDTARHFIMFDAPAWTFEQIENFLGAKKTVSTATN